MAQPARQCDRAGKLYRPVVQRSASLHFSEALVEAPKTRAFILHERSLETIPCDITRFVAPAHNTRMRGGRIGTPSCCSALICYRNNGDIAIYPRLNLLASPSKTNRSPVTSRMSNRVRVPSILDCGMPPLTRRCPLSLVAQIVGKSFPLRINSVHARARSPGLSVARSSNITKLASALWCQCQLRMCP